MALKVSFRHKSARMVAVFSVGALASGMVMAAGSPASGATSCSPAGSTGLTAAMVATESQTISGSVDATGCNLGIYIGPGVTGVTVNGATVSNATDHAILAEDTSAITIENNTISNNGTKAEPQIAGDDAIFFAGVSGSTITGNTVSGDYAGGTRVADDGPVDPAAPDAGPPTQVPSVNDTVSNNKYSDVYGGCGIVVATYNSGPGVQNVTVTGNTITGAIGQFGPHGPVIGQIVLAGDGVGAQIQNVTVSNNTVTQSIPTGIVVHANAPGDVISGTVISGNTLSLNNWGKSNGGPEPTAIALEAEAIPGPSAPRISGTTVAGNRISSEYYGLWVSSASQVTDLGFGSGTTITQTNTISGAAFPLYTRPATGAGAFIASSTGAVAASGGVNSFGSVSKLTAPVAGVAATRDSGGYWVAGRDGNVYSFGDAGLQQPQMPTSLPAEHVTPRKPIVGIVPTPDAAGGNGTGTSGLGYWLVASDGGVFNFGDAPFKGSAGALRLNQPVVGMAATSDGQGYWLVASDGGVFTYGDAHFYGSLGAKRINKPIVAVIPTTDDHGYALVAADGGVFNFGDSAFAGSLGNQRLSAPIVGARAAAGPGYWMVDANGKVYNFGSATSIPAASKLAPGTVTGFDISGEYPTNVSG
jgi:hypothetical protein